MAVHHVVHEGGDSGLGFLLAVIIIVLAVFFFFFYGFPRVQQAVPAQINVPEKIDVNIQQQGTGTPVQY